MSTKMTVLPNWTLLSQTLSVLFDSRPPNFRRPDALFSMTVLFRPIIFWPIRTPELYLILYKREQRNHRYQKCRSRCSIRVLLKVFGFLNLIFECTMTHKLWVIVYDMTTWSKFFTWMIKIIFKIFYLIIYLYFSWFFCFFHVIIIILISWNDRWKCRYHVFYV